MIATATPVREFVAFEVDGALQGIADDGRVLEIESIHYRGALGETHITYYDGGETHVLVRSGRQPTKQRTY